MQSLLPITSPATIVGERVVGHRADDPWMEENEQGVGHRAYTPWMDQNEQEVGDCADHHDI